MKSAVLPKSGVSMPGVDAAQARLGVRHRAGIEPHVDQVGLAGHLAARGADQEYLVHVGTVEVDLVVIVLGHVRGVEAAVAERVGGHEAGGDGLVDLGIKLLDGADADLFLAVLAAPDRERRAPVAAAAEVPVLDVLQPLAEAARAGGLRLPGDLFVQGHHLLAHGRGPDEPAVQRIIEHRLVGAPAVRVGVDVLLDLEGLAGGLEHHAEVDVQGRGVRREGAVVGVLDVAAGPLGVVRAHVRGDILRVEVFQAEEPALQVHLRLRIAVAVDDLQGGDARGTWTMPVPSSVLT